MMAKVMYLCYSKDSTLPKDSGISWDSNTKSATYENGTQPRNMHQKPYGSQGYARCPEREMETSYYNSARRWSETI